MRDPFVERADRSDDGRFDHLFPVFTARMNDVYHDTPLSHADLQQLFSTYLYYAGGAASYLQPDQIDVPAVELQFEALLNRDIATLRRDCDIVRGRCDTAAITQRSMELTETVRRLLG